MPIAGGTRFGAYEVVSLIGSGGMGEVYRARDLNLKRDVALKVLPASFEHVHKPLQHSRPASNPLAAMKQRQIWVADRSATSEKGTAVVTPIVEQRG